MDYEETQAGITQSVAPLRSGPVRVKPSIRKTATAALSLDSAPFSRMAIFNVAPISRRGNMSARWSQAGALRSRTGGLSFWTGVITVAGAKDDSRDAQVLNDSLRADRRAFRCPLP